MSCVIFLFIKANTQLLINLHTSISVESNLFLFVCSQLLGFVYACYVVSAITEEEDSCELLNHTLTHTEIHS